MSREHEILTGVVSSVDPKTKNVTIEIGKAETVLVASEQIPGETLKEGGTVKVYVVEVRKTSKGPQVMISRTHPGLVKRLFELEVPEIYDGTVEIKSISREAGSRTKIAVYSKDSNVDAIGACVGPKGARVGNIVGELKG
jgi:N utilization substance protein A